MNPLATAESIKSPATETMNKCFPATTETIQKPTTETIQNGSWDDGNHKKTNDGNHNKNVG